MLLFRTSSLLCLQNCWFYNTNVQVVSTTTITTDSQLLHIHQQDSKAMNQDPFLSEDAPSCFYPLEGTVSFLNLLCATVIYNQGTSWAGKDPQGSCSPAAGPAQDSQEWQAVPECCPRLSPPPQLLYFQFIHFEQQLTAAAVSRSIDVMVPLLQQSKQGTISSHTRAMAYSTVFSAKLQFCRCTENGICGGAWRRHWHWTYLFSANLAEKVSDGNGAAPAQSAKLPGKLQPRHRGPWQPLELKAVCISSGIAEFPLLCFVPQISTD